MPDRQGSREARHSSATSTLLIARVTKLYGPKHALDHGVRLPDESARRLFGVSYAKQALYLTQAYAIARKNPRIDMMLWFLVKDEPNLGGWQSGLETPRRQEEAGLERVPEDPARLTAGSGRPRLREQLAVQSRSTSSTSRSTA